MLAAPFQVLLQDLWGNDLPSGIAGVADYDGLHGSAAGCSFAQLCIKLLAQAPVITQVHWLWMAPAASLCTQASGVSCLVIQYFACRMQMRIQSLHAIQGRHLLLLDTRAEKATPADHCQRPGSMVLECQWSLHARQCRR